MTYKKSASESPIEWRLSWLWSSFPWLKIQFGERKGKEMVGKQIMVINKGNVAAQCEDDGLFRANVFRYGWCGWVRARGKGEVLRD